MEELVRERLLTDEVFGESIERCLVVEMKQ